MAGSCKFRSADEEVLGQVIFGCRSTKLRRQILEKPDISLAKILQMGRAHEVAELQATEIEGHVKKLQGEEAKFVAAAGRGGQGRRAGSVGRMDWRTEGPRRPWEQRRGASSSSNDPTSESCGQCGHEPHREEDCPAYGVSCNRCGQRNHYARMCRTGSGRRGGRRGRRDTIHLVTDEGLAGLTVTESGDVPEEYGADTMGVEHSWAVSEAPWEEAEEMVLGAREAVRCWVTVNGKNAKAIIDTGATTNVMRGSLFQQLCPKVPLRTPTRRLYALGQVEPLKVRGVAEVDIGYGDKRTRSLVYVTSQVTGFLLSKEVSIKLGLIAVLCQPEHRHTMGGKRGNETSVGKDLKDTRELDHGRSTRDTVIGASQAGRAIGAERKGFRDTKQGGEAGSRTKRGAKKRRKGRRTKQSWKKARRSPSGEECPWSSKGPAQETVSEGPVKRRYPGVRKRRASTPGSQGSDCEGRPRARRQRPAAGRPGGARGSDADGASWAEGRRSPRKKGSEEMVAEREKKGKQDGAGPVERKSGHSRREEKKPRDVGTVKDNKG